MIRIEVHGWLALVNVIAIPVLLFLLGMLAGRKMTEYRQRHTIRSLFEAADRLKRLGPIRHQPTRIIREADHGE